MTDREKNCITYTLLATLAVTGFLAVLAATKPGIALYSDSTYYFGLARRLLEGHGYTLLNAYGEVDPVPKYPWVYPTILAIPGVFGMDLFAGARWSSALIFAANIFMAGVILYRCSGRSTGTAALGAFLMLASYDTLSYHTVALSDAPFLLLTLVGFYLLGSHLEKPSWPAFLLGATATGIALSIRYVGGAFVVAGIAAILLWGKKDAIRRVADACLFVAISCLPMSLWLLRNITYGGGATGRRLGFHPAIDRAQIKELTLAFSAWASGGSRSQWDLSFRGPVIEAAVLLVLIYASRSLLRGRKADQGIAFPTLYILSYGMVLLAASTLLQADLFLDSLRMLIPLHVLMIFLVLIQGNILYRGLKTKPARSLTAVVVLASAAVFAVWAWDFIKDNAEDGQGYASSSYKESELLEAVRSLPPDARFFSNLPWPIGLHCNRPWSLLPTKVDITSLRTSSRYPSELQSFTRALRQTNVYLAYFKQGDEWFQFPSIEEIRACVPLQVVEEADDGTIFEVAR